MKYKSKACCFIPRDAGFFSVFNFLIGSIEQQLHAYPLFNKKIFEHYNHQPPKHFCYWGSNNNSWFDYFGPISYYDDDDTHISKKIYELPIINGSHIASEEFTHPAAIKKLFLDYDRFNSWRHRIHEIYQQYIHLNQNITTIADNIFYNIGDTPTIGIHYRHPSHSIESGCLYLKDYFQKIDSLLIKHPDAKIFIASDTMFGILAFKEKYPDQIFYIDTVDRLDLDNILQWAFALIKHNNIDVVGFINNKGYELQHQQSENSTIDPSKLTTDLLTETICLSKCDYLVHGLSNIALAISYINPKLKFCTLL